MENILSPHHQSLFSKGEKKMNTIRLDHVRHKIIMDSVFYKNSLNPRNIEYTILQNTRHDYPNYEPVKHTIKKNPTKKTYSGLTYAYMEDYILTHESAETVNDVLDEFNEMILISECHSRAFRYPAIKKWFLQKYPEIVRFGLPQKPTIININQIATS